MNDKRDRSRYADRPLYPRFLLAMVRGGTVAVRRSPDVTAFEGWGPDDLRIVIDIAKAELDRQTSNLDRVLGRSQALFTALLALIGLWLTIATPQLFQSLAWEEIAISGLLLVAVSLYFLALAGAVAVIVVRKQFDVVSATQIARWESFDLLELAREYVACLPTGRDVANNHLTVFGTAVKFTIAGSVLFGVARLLPSW